MTNDEIRDHRRRSARLLFCPTKPGLYGSQSAHWRRLAWVFIQRVVSSWILPIAGAIRRTRPVHPGWENDLLPCPSADNLRIVMERRDGGLSQTAIVEHQGEQYVFSPRRRVKIAARRRQDLSPLAKTSPSISPSDPASRHRRPVGCRFSSLNSSRLR